ncbi:hemerythrin domain-containing protein [Streptomyces sp. NPDC046909]|uniref:hemerythrin domain-containing protein n=1 Tax=Streptomyces sp. NPDC046909 TaxID=3155617 RepID=UPI0033DBEC50
MTTVLKQLTGGYVYIDRKLRFMVTLENVEADNASTTRQGNADRLGYITTWGAIGTLGSTCDSTSLSFCVTSPLQGFCNWAQDPGGMTSSNTHGSAVHPYTREMAMVHQVFRRASRLLAELVQGVRRNNSASALVLAEHWRLYSEGLHAHHTGADELLWSVLLPHLRLAAEQALAMDAQHHELNAGMAVVQGLMDR